MGDFKMILIGFAAMIGGVILTFLADSLTMLRISQMMVGFAVGICEPLLMAVSIQHLSPAEKPAALGFHQTVYAVGMFTGPFLSGLLAGWLGLKVMFLVTAIILLIFCWIFLRNLYKNQTPLDVSNEENAEAS